MAVAQGTDRPGVYVLLPGVWMGRTQVHYYKVVHSIGIVAAGILRTEAPAADHRGSYQRHAPGDGAGGSNADICRTTLIGIELLKHTSKKEGINWFRDKWIYFVFLANVLGAISGLYDKYLMASPANGGVGLNKMAVQGWYNIYQFFMMAAMLVLLWWPTRKKTTPFHWHWSIPLISIFLSMADFVYFYALGLDGAMISVVSMVRRGSVIVSFLCGAMIFHEKNLKAKAFDLMLVLLSMLLLYIGSN